VEKFCPSKSRTLFLDDQLDEVQDESQKEVFIGNEGSDSEDDTRHEEFLTSIRCVAVVRYTLVQSKETDDWRRTTIFHTWTKMVIRTARSLLIVKVA